ncbi:MAG TPA: hypothetical protein VMG98_00225 [Verrucomicrobiae bacterium]|nr:hypothetical protein [Verrucomicrobiae bacterium]
MSYTFEDFREKIAAAVEQAIIHFAIPASFNGTTYVWTRDDVQVSLSENHHVAWIQVSRKQIGSHIVRFVGVRFPSDELPDEVLTDVAHAVVSCLTDPRYYACEMTLQDKMALEECLEGIRDINSRASEALGDMEHASQAQIKFFPPSFERLDLAWRFISANYPKFIEYVDSIRSLRSKYPNDVDVLDAVLLFSDIESQYPIASRYSVIKEAWGSSRFLIRAGITAYIATLTIALWISGKPYLSTGCIPATSADAVELLLIIIFALAFPPLVPFLRVAWCTLRGVPSQSAFPWFLVKWYRAAPTLTIIAGGLVALSIVAFVRFFHATICPT